MKVLFRTNIDAYQMATWPVIGQAPRVGEMVEITPHTITDFRSKKLPIRLQVVSVTWKFDCVECELWYNSTDKQLAEMAGAKTL